MPIRIEALAKGRELEFGWVLDLSRAATVVIIAFAIGGSSARLAYSEVICAIVMLIEVLRRDAECCIGSPEHHKLAT
jgi:hypothetical protein